MSEKVVVRFAPSPTGYLHIGGARTALFNYLFARHSGGAFLLRIEDTDRERSTPEACAAILEGLRWLGLHWDGEPLYQTGGLERHLKAARQLLESGHAYRCFCTPEELEIRREKARAQKLDFQYDRTCLALEPAEADKMAAQGRPHVVRFRIPEGSTEFEDLVYGPVRFANSTVEDFVILRSDNSPTYQLAVVADDIEMGITHVIRGDDHLSNPPKQILLYRALGAAVPHFAHLPLILGPDKKRLSKRHGATSLTEYRGMGFIAPAVFNFLVLLGWTPPEEREIFMREELIRLFSLEEINKKSAVFDQAKLEWMNGRYLAQMEAVELLELARDDFERAGLLTENSTPEQLGKLLKVLDLAKERCRLTGDLLPRSRFFFPVELEYERKAVEQHWKAGTVIKMTALRDKLLEVEVWQSGPLEEALRSLAEKLQLSAAGLIHPLRVALTGGSVSPGIFETMELMGRELTLSRLGTAIDRLG
ncbi:MAG: glutamate--tRNA ligase [Candidatus Glassbacteria bacterium RIFCSPLOWO2_12_FULL_58_11]|uniref:Glutamate--tRNA ligase n=1 Tax=Candidatus Glassbacteria bacterium RIFCSPLOWO2_12_FULL_58_11 TaxID=1817867 RepID=A0A1F5YLG9_9BACT|nr:MAG: glutamate--tRNA ligase [Candidatus Glassbacteria bacterium RIFCSPLOWO2_12_FULL_58_11]